VALIDPDPAPDGKVDSLCLHARYPIHGRGHEARFHHGGAMVLCLASQQRFAVAIGSSAMRPITPSRMAAAMLASAMMLAASISASADEIRVTSSNALKPVLEQVAPEFENATGHKLVFTWGQAEILKGTSFDLVVLTAARR
jgi:ABC-type molybdate transport system substrate-binding protein